MVPGFYLFRPYAAYYHPMVAQVVRRRNHHLMARFYRLDGNPELGRSDDGDMKKKTGRCAFPILVSVADKLGQFVPVMPRFQDLTKECT